MSKPRLAVLTASIDPEATRKYWESWRRTQMGEVDYYCVWNAPTAHRMEFPYELELELPFKIIASSEIMGVVPAYYYGLKDIAIRDKYDLVACFHDDLRIYEQGWDLRILEHFDANPKCGLAGFGGAKGLGAEDIYYNICAGCNQNYKAHLAYGEGTKEFFNAYGHSVREVPYQPYQLARQDFASNLKDAEVHGRRITAPERAVCFDGFSQIGRPAKLFAWFEEIYESGITHHFYDSYLGALAYRDGWESYTLPIACYHAGGVTAVGNAAYHEWANKVIEGGDKGFWEEAHKIGYEKLKGILPIRVD